MSIFNKISLKRPKRTPFNLSYQSKFTLDFGKLCPIMCEKVVPGDKFVHSHEFLMRFAPFANQVFQGFQVRTEYFFVPSRLLWKNFESFLAKGVNGQVDYVHPYINLASLYDGETNWINSLLDYFNLPTGTSTNFIDGSATNDLKIDALPFYAYCKIMLDYYLDENLFPSSIPAKTIDSLLNSDFNQFVNDGNSYDDLFSMLANIHIIQGASPDSLLTPLNVYQPFKRSYPKDYFTSALPSAQRGPIVQIPLNGSGDVIVRGLDNSGGRIDTYGGVFAKYKDNGISSEMTEVTLFSTDAVRHSFSGSGSTDVATNLSIGSSDSFTPYNASSPDSINAFKSAATERPITFKAVNVNGTATITDLRTAMVVQGWLEKNARAGVRSKELIAAHFGVRSKDYRLDRAELLGRYKSTVQIGETFTTAANTDESFIPGMGVSNATGSEASRPWKRTFEEHGYVIGIMSVFPTAAYQQGIPRQFSELDVFDYYWPEFQNIGEQEIKRKELFIDDQSGTNNEATFGYIPRYAHYKSRTNQIHGDFRDSLRFMVASRDFSSNPLLNNKFINVDVAYNDLYRVFNATTELASSSPVYVDMYHKFYAKRPMQYFGSPRIF